MVEILENPEKYAFVTIADRDLTATLPDGSDIYTRENFTPEPGKPIDVDTLCTTRVFLAAPAKLNKKQQKALRKVAAQDRWKIYSRK